MKTAEEFINGEMAEQCELEDRQARSWEERRWHRFEDFEASVQGAAERFRNGLGELWDATDLDGVYDYSEFESRVIEEIADVQIQRIRELEAELQELRRERAA